MPEISVIIPVYNKEAYIEKALNSVLQQSFRDFECLLIDDGSSDRSGFICDVFASQDERFKVFHIPNGGVSHARNVGLDHAEGAYLTFVDADDLLHPEFLGNMHHLICREQVDLVISGVEKYHMDSSQRDPMVCGKLGKYPFPQILETFATEQKRSGIYGSCVAKLFPKTLAEGIRFDESLKLAEDFDFYLRLYENVETVYQDDKLFYYYLQEAENSSVCISDDQIDYVSQLRISLRYREFLVKQGGYTKENKDIVDMQILSYLYLSLHYAPLSDFKTRFYLLREWMKGVDITRHAGSLYRRCLLNLLYYNRCSLAKMLVAGYRWIRSLLR